MHNTLAIALNMIKHSGFLHIFKIMHMVIKAYTVDSKYHKCQELYCSPTNIKLLIRCNIAFFGAIGSEKKEFISVSLPLIEDENEEEVASLNNKDILVYGGKRAQEKRRIKEEEKKKKKKQKKI